MRVRVEEEEVSRPGPEQRNAAQCSAAQSHPAPADPRPARHSETAAQLSDFYAVMEQVEETGPGLIIM